MQVTVSLDWHDAPPCCCCGRDRRMRREAHPPQTSETRRHVRAKPGHDQTGSTTKSPDTKSTAPESAPQRARAKSHGSGRARAPERRPSPRRGAPSRSPKQIVGRRRQTSPSRSRSRRNGRAPKKTPRPTRICPTPSSRSTTPPTARRLDVRQVAAVAARRLAAADRRLRRDHGRAIARATPRAAHRSRPGLGSRLAATLVLGGLTLAYQWQPAPAKPDIERMYGGDRGELELGTCEVSDAQGSSHGRVGKPDRVAARVSRGSRAARRAVGRASRVGRRILRRSPRVHRPDRLARKPSSSSTATTSVSRRPCGAPPRSPTI